MYEFKNFAKFTEAQMNEFLKNWSITNPLPKTGKSLYIALPGMVAIKVTKEKRSKLYLLEIAAET